MSKKVLVVDDNEGTVNWMKQILEKEGYEVASAYNGMDGYQQALKIRPDAILLDIMMPIMDGYTMNQHLKENPDTRTIPVIIISALRSIRATEKSVPIEGYLVKPVSSNVLLVKLDEVFKAKTP
jgi:two-component system cell cycle response regulator